MGVRNGGHRQCAGASEQHALRHVVVALATPARGGGNLAGREQSFQRALGAAPAPSAARAAGVSQVMGPASARLGAKASRLNA